MSRYGANRVREGELDLGVIAGRFRVTGFIGRGNMGQVHEAEDLQAAPDSPERFATTLHLTPRYRLPETTRAADHLCRQTLAQATA